MKRLMIIIFTILSIVIITGCSDKNLYNAKIVTQNYEFNEEFLLNNKTFGAYLKDGYYIDDEKYPKERMIIINNESDFNNAFKIFEDIDFNEEMIVIHAFTTASNSEYELKNINFAEKKLTIEYCTKKTNGINPPNASIPDTKWLVVKINRLDIEYVDFIFLV